MCTVMAGVLLVVMGLTGMGSAVKFIPRPIVVGFTNGIAILIASTQVKDFFGLQIDEGTGRVLRAMEAFATHFRTLNYDAALLAVGDRGHSDRVPQHSQTRFPVRSSRWCSGLRGVRLQIAGGDDRHALRRNSQRTAAAADPEVPRGSDHGLLGPAVTVAMLGAIESLMSAVVSDRMSNDQHNPNVELVAQGVANIVSPMFGGLPATGAIARTATNIRSGAQTPVAGMIHALTLLCILLFAAPLVAYVPMAVLAGILMVVSYNMGEWREIPQLLKLTKTDHQRLAGDVRANGVCRPDGGGGSGNDPGGAAVHQPGGERRRRCRK